MLSKQSAISIQQSVILIVSGILLTLISACSPNQIAQLLASPTPPKTATPTLAPTRTPTATPTITPTPQPAARVQEADHELFNGNWDRAITLYQSALNANGGNGISAAARFGIAFTRLQANQLDASLSEFIQFIQAYPTNARIAEAHFHVGSIYQVKGDWANAIKNYERYLTLKPGVIDSYIWERIGRSYIEWGKYDQAAEAYSQAILVERSTSLLPLVEKKAEALRAKKDYAGAIALYDLTANSSTSRLTLARMDILRGQVEISRGNSKAAYAHWQHAVDNYPETYDSYQAIIALLDAGIKQDELQRAIINYNANQFANTLASLDRYFASTPQPEAKAYYYAALTHRALGRTQSAIQRFQDVIDKYPDDVLWNDAWKEKAYTQWGWGDDYNGAVDTLARFAEVAPTHPSATANLYEAGRIAERGNNLPRAIQIWSSLNTKYPDSSYAPEGSFFAGVTLYRTNDLVTAIKQFEIAATHPKSDAEQRAASWLWIGKIKKALGDKSASEAFVQGVTADAGGYYSLRAAELRDGKTPFNSSRYDFSFDYQKEKNEAEKWLAAKLNIPNVNNTNVLNDKRWVRAKALWTLNLTAEAKEEFTALRTAYIKDAVALYQMSLAMRDLGVYTQAIRAMRSCIDALGITDTFSVPPFFTHIRFGPYYSDLIIKAANDYNLDPLFVLALMRQESLFESVAVSSSAAQGLMQIIPPTGDWISKQIKWQNYQVRDLQRPYINVEFGAFYLDRQRDDFNGDLYAALAAYNAGPGNSAKWAQISKGDPDLFVEVIRLDQPRDYVRRIYEFYYIYKNLYGR